jgi:anti-sigma regulatory factor (Ser/Thr protein kinase)
MSALIFPASFEYLDEIRSHVAEKARAAGFVEKAVYAIQLAADEAASNIIEHAYAGRTDGSFEMTCEFEQDRLIITFRDHGISFDISKVSKPDLKADLSERKIGGLGIYLMHKLMDEVRYSSTGSENTLTLTKRKE